MEFKEGDRVIFSKNKIIEGSHTGIIVNTSDDFYTVAFDDTALVNPELLEVDRIGVLKCLAHKYLTLVPEMPKEFPATEEELEKVYALRDAYPKFATYKRYFVKGKGNVDIINWYLHGMVDIDMMEEAYYVLNLETLNWENRSVE